MKTGFSLIEMTIAVAIILAVTGAVFALMDPAHGVFRAQPEAIDEQQRIRVAAETITRELQWAGSGIQAFAPLLPYRRGAAGADPPGTFSPSRVSTVSIPVAAAQTFVSLATDGGNAVYVQARNGCPGGDPLCGFAPNTTVVIFDESGSFDTFRVSAVQAQPPALLRAVGTLSRSYPAGAIVAQATLSTLSARSNGAAGGELMRYDGNTTDLPVVDDVTALGFEYYGDPAPPVLRRPLSDPEGPWTSYGPKPPEVGVDDPETASYGPGENCLFTVVDGATVVRPEISQLGAGSTLVRLDEGRLTDGPWCPDPTAANRFDADLLRVRRVRVTFRVRGKPIVFDIAPRNLILRR